MKPPKKRPKPRVRRAKRTIAYPRQLAKHLMSLALTAGIGSR